jgi:hypothetical protein
MVGHNIQPQDTAVLSTKLRYMYHVIREAIERIDWNELAQGRIARKIFAQMAIDLWVFEGRKPLQQLSD